MSLVEEERPFADLEIHITPGGAGGYGVTLHTAGRDWTGRMAPLADLPAGVETLTGEVLFNTLLGDAELRSGWDVGRGLGARRVRLRISQLCPELHALPWERLRGPDGDLAAGPETPFSRLMESSAAWALPLKPPLLRVLVVIANPAGLEKWNLHPVDVEKERAAVEGRGHHHPEEDLSPFPLPLREGGSEGDRSHLDSTANPLQRGTAGVRLSFTFLTENVTLPNIQAALRAGGYQALHFIGHGGLSQRTGQGALLLEKPGGGVQPVNEQKFAEMLADLPDRPALVFLSACDSDTHVSGDALLGMAPRLVAAGVPAVVAMRGLLAMEGNRTLVPAFYEALAAHGDVDRALNAARAALLSAALPGADPFGPVLYLRPGSARLWAEHRLTLREVIRETVAGLETLPAFEGQVDRFLTAYLGTETAPAPFGGRAEALADLDSWLADPNAPRLLGIFEPAGRGKSALVTQWVRRVMDRSGGPHVVFFPVSLRYGTHRAEVVFAGLAARMARLFGEQSIRASSAEAYKSLFLDFLRRPPPDGRPVLIVVDGLDEAAGWRPGPDLFPTDPPAHLRVVATARLLAGDRGPRGWLARLGWKEAASRLLALPLISRAGVEDVLARMGAPLDGLAARAEVVDQLFRLSSQGDPLILRLYVEDLWALGEAASRLRVEDLAALKPDLEGYFERWFEDQRRAWGTENPLRDKAVRDFLRLCALEAGPLTMEDVLALLPGQEMDALLVAEAARAVARFVVGDGSERGGYVFSHPRLAEYFTDPVRLTRPERAAWEGRFLAYGKATLEGLVSGSVRPAGAPRYPVAFYGLHLERANAPDADLYALVCEPWLRAWEHHTGTPDGFLGDVDRAWKRAEKDRSAIGMQARAALCFASVASLGQNLGNSWIVSFLQGGVLSWRLARVYIRQKTDAKERVNAFDDLALVLTGVEREEALVEALVAAEQIIDEGDRAVAISFLAGKLPEHVLDEALALARCIHEEGSRARALLGVAPQLPEGEREALWYEILALVRRLPEMGEHSILLARLAEVERGARREVVAREALNAIPRVSLDYYLGEVMKKLPEDLPVALLKNALAQALSIEDEERCAGVLRIMAPRLPDELRAVALRWAALKPESRRVHLLSALLPSLPETCLMEAVAIAREVSRPEDRASLLARLAPRLPSREREEARDEALAMALRFENELWREEVVHLLLPLLSLEKGLQIARQFSYVESQVRSLCTLVQGRPEEESLTILREALAKIRQLSEERRPWEFLASLITGLPELLLDDALAAIREVSRLDARLNLMLALAQRLPEAKRAPIVIEALDMGLLTWLPVDPEYEKALILLTHMAPVALLPRLADTARKIGMIGSKLKILSVIAARLPTGEGTSALNEELAEARRIKDGIVILNTLTALAGLLEPSERGDQLAFCVALALKLRDSWNGVEELLAIAMLQPEGERVATWREALEAALKIDSLDFQVMALESLVAAMPEGQSGLMLAAIRNVGHFEAQASLMVDLARGLPARERSRILPVTLAAALDIPEKEDSIRLLLELAGTLEGQERSRVITEALDVYNRLDAFDFDRDARKRAVLLAQGRPSPALEDFLGRALPEDQRERFWSQALTKARMESNPQGRFSMLVAMAGMLSEEHAEAIWDEAILAAYELPHEFVWAIEITAYILPPGPRSSMTSLAYQWLSGRDLIRALGALAEGAPEGERTAILEQALEVVKQEKSEAYKAHLLESLAEVLSERNLPALLPAARRISPEAGRAGVYSRMVSILEGADLAWLYGWLFAHPYEEISVNTLRKLLDRWPALIDSTGKDPLPLLTEILRAYAPCKRAELLSILAALAPVIHAAGGSQAINETFEAIEDAARWWP